MTTYKMCEIMISRNALTGINRILTDALNYMAGLVQNGRNALTGINRILTLRQRLPSTPPTLSRNALTGINRILTEPRPSSRRSGKRVVMPLRALIGF